MLRNILKRIYIMNKLTVKAKTELLSTSIGAFNNAEEATALVWAKYDALTAAGIEPSYFAPYFKKGGKNATVNEECTASKEQAEAIVAEFLYHHKDRDTIVAFKAMTKEEAGDKTVNELKKLKQIADRPGQKQRDFRKAFQAHVNRAENAALKEKAKNDPEAAKELDEKLDSDFKAKQLKALSASAKQAKDKLSEDEYSQVNAAYKTLVAFYNS
tara:strand:- start:184 stop:825 length:642 start_codon:yes stop_codon:yes gene_type:complete